MGSALNSVMGGNGGILGAVGGIVGGIFGGPIGAMLGQAIGNMLQDAIGGAAKGAVDHLQKEHGMPKFLADEVKQKIDEVLGQQRNNNVPQDVQQAAQGRYGDAFKDFQQQFEQNLIRSILDGMKDGDNPDMLRAYLERHPNGAFAPLAKVRLGELGRATTPSSI